MKKLSNSKGFSLIEMLVALAVLVILVMGMDATLSTAVRVYSDSIFQSNSASLAGILNTAVGDILRYAEDVTINPGLTPDPNDGAGFEDSDGSILNHEDVGFVFTNYEYGARSAYFYTTVFNDGSSRGTLQIKNLKNSSIVELVNTGSYPNLEISNFKIEFVAPSAIPVPGTENGNYFRFSYDILDTTNEQHQLHVEDYTVRLLNP